MHKNTVHLNILLILSTFIKREKILLLHLAVVIIKQIKTVFVSKVLKLLFSSDLFFSVLLTAVNDSKT